MVYLLHYVRGLHRAQHYLGYLGLRDNHYQRIRTHANGTSGAHLQHVFYQQGIPFIIARTWWDGDRTVERKLKNLKNARLLCPICRVATLKSKAAYLKAWRACRNKLRPT